MIAVTYLVPKQERLVIGTALLSVSLLSTLSSIVWFMIRIKHTYGIHEAQHGTKNIKKVTVVVHEMELEEMINCNNIP